MEGPSLWAALLVLGAKLGESPPSISKGNSMRILVAISTIVAVTALAGCGKHDTKTYTDSNGNSVAVSNNGDGHMTVTGSNGEKVEFGSGAAATAKMPSYLPLYPGAKVTTSFTGSGKDGAGGMVAFQVAASAADVVSFYKAKATSAGLAQTMSAEMGDTTTYVAANDKTKHTVSVSATKGSDGTTVQITWSEK